MSVGAQFLTHASESSNARSGLVWRTDASQEQTIAQLEQAIGIRDGSWTDGSFFQLAPNCDPWAPVLSGRVRATAEGAEITAELAVRQEIRDILRLGRWILFVIIAVLALGALWQLRGTDLWLSLGGLALGAAFSAGTHAILQACMLETAKKTVNKHQLCELLTRMLRS